MSGQPFFGKYRGVVTDNQDPNKLGRIRATVPDVFGDDESGWALPCAPFGGGTAGFFALPGKGAGVWIEFEHGDPDYPVWTGCWFGSTTDLPSALLSSPPDQVMVVTAKGAKITLSDLPGSGGITLETAEGAKVSLTAQGIELDNGKGASVKLSGTQVSVNGGALEVV